jgi:probable rRNA maturation factor
MSVKMLKRVSVKVSPPDAASTLQRFNASTVMITNRQRTKKINARKLKQIVSALLSHLKLEDAELGINLVGATEMTRVNRQFLGHEGSTDVITFDHRGAVGETPAPVAADVRRRTRSRDLTGSHRLLTSAATQLPGAVTSPDSSFVIRHSSLPLHGELFICVDDAVAQARAFQTSWQSEVVRYTVHGVLHLLGYDDVAPVLRRQMKREENRLVKRLEHRFSLAQWLRVAKLGA